jgi:hypothetical protein
MTNLSPEQVDSLRVDILKKQSAGVTKVGYWKSKYEPGYPEPIADSATAEQVAEMLHNLKRLTNNAHVVQYRGWSTCRICGKSNGTKEYEKTVEGVEYHIPEGLAHYISKHAVLVHLLHGPGAI